MGARNQVVELENRIAKLEQENLRLQEKVTFLTRKLYGRSTERTSALGIEGQMSLFDEAETSVNPKSAEPDMKDVGSYVRRKYSGQREELLKDIPHEKKLCTLAEEDRFCQVCGAPLTAVGEEYVRTEIEFIPAKVRVIDYYRETFECRSCRKNGNQYMEKSPMPSAVLTHSYASASTVAWVIHQKYELAVPLYRQEKEWADLGVNLSRATMSNWMIASYRDWLSPVVELLKKNCSGRTTSISMKHRYRYFGNPEEKIQLTLTCGCTVPSKTAIHRFICLITGRGATENTPENSSKDFMDISTQMLTKGTRKCPALRDASAGPICADTL